MAEYNHKKIEKKWREAWEKSGLYKISDTLKGPKSYVLDMFPYPSGDGLHVGHPKGYFASDIYSRFKRMNGFAVLHPMGWDAFGLPAENFAIKNKLHPRVAVKKNIARFKEQLSLLGFNYDWDREINTTNPEYYRWTQWIFLKLFERGLAYESHEPINWCPSCKTGLANEDLEGGKCERCGSIVEKRPLRQWVLRITDYADRLLQDLEGLNWPASIKESQRNWIGRSEGAEIDFTIKGTDFKIKVFTTRADTLFGATYVALAPEHELVKALRPEINNWKKAAEYIEVSRNKPEIERTAADKEKTGVKLQGVKAINPANGEELPIFIADYVLAHYGTGAVMAVPAHDERDWVFAKKFKLPIKQVICQFYPEPKCPVLEDAYIGDGKLVSSGKFNGMDAEKAKKSITEFVGGKTTVKYKLRDWVFSRQRYWGEPIPLIHCEKCGVVAVPESDLPVKLPEVKFYEPMGTGESPLANIAEWVNVKCPKCSGKGKRETNTMPQWAGSSWYYLRYIDPQNGKELVDKKKEKYWSPVDVYVGGAEHATRHLIYARFWHKFLYDLGVVDHPEPFSRLQNVGLITAKDGKKMSKRYGNVVNPDDIVEAYGADTLRVYEMFMGPFDQTVAWSSESIIGARRFLEKAWRAQNNLIDSQSGGNMEKLSHQTIKKVSEDIEGFRFNTAISQLMIFTNAMDEQEELSRGVYELFIKILAPFAPHMAEEIWEQLGHKTSIHSEKWPEYNPELVKEEVYELVIQINGKVRDKAEVDADLGEDGLREFALKQPRIKELLEGKDPKKVIVVRGRLVNIVI
ncbi:MAG: leucine--tRNA ligase [Candidatus Niyogibacteria bacterium]|nr:leucine--tRNA ligase [Candidatus Niyogibacteria bacterium]